MKNLLPILVGLMLSCTNQPAESLMESEKAEINQEVKEMLHEYHQAISEGGLMAEFEYLDSSEDFYWVPPGYKHLLNFDSVKTILTRNASTYKQVDFHWESLRIFPLSRTIANFSGIVGGTMIDTAGNSIAVSMIESGTCIKRADQWKLLSGQTASLN